MAELTNCWFSFFNIITQCSTHDVDIDIKMHLFWYEILTLNTYVVEYY